MKTDNLIKALAADQNGPTTPFERSLMLGLLPGLALAVLLYAVLVGPRPHLMALLPAPRLVFKLIFPWIVAACALPLVMRLAEPGADARRYGQVLLALAAILLIAVGLELFVLPEAEWRTYWIGHNAKICMTLIPILAFGPLVAALIVLKRGAPTNPTLAGAGAGLFAAAIGAALYATHCPDDSPLFVACWYSLATIVVVTVGAIAGSRWLRW
ncbi:MAG TPA: NrsF family protein [Methylovirgula sp.]